MEAILRNIKEGLKNTGYVAVADIVNDGVKKLVEFTPAKGPVARAVGGITLLALGSYVRDPTAKTIIDLAGALALWGAVKEFLKEKGMYPLSGREISLQITPEVIPPEVVYVPPKKKEVEVLNAGFEIA